MGLLRSREIISCLGVLLVLLPLLALGRISPVFPAKQYDVCKGAKGTSLEGLVILSEVEQIDGNDCLHKVTYTFLQKHREGELKTKLKSVTVPGAVDERNGCWKGCAESVTATSPSASQVLLKTHSCSCIDRNYLFTIAASGVRAQEGTIQVNTDNGEAFKCDALVFVPCDQAHSASLSGVCPMPSDAMLGTEGDDCTSNDRIPRQKGRPSDEDIPSRTGGNNQNDDVDIDDPVEPLPDTESNPFLPAVNDTPTTDDPELMLNDTVFHPGEHWSDNVPIISHAKDMGLSTEAIVGITIAALVVGIGILLGVGAAVGFGGLAVYKRMRRPAEIRPFGPTEAGEVEMGTVNRNPYADSYTNDNRTYSSRF